MSIGCFSDRSIHPGEAQVLEAVGQKLPLWQELIASIRAAYPVEEDYKFLYGKTYGWALRFRVRGQLLVSLFPTREGFTAQVNLSPEAVEAALGLSIGENARQAVARARPYPEGCWLFVPVETHKDVSDVLRLAALRAETKKIVK